MPSTEALFKMMSVIKIALEAIDIFLHAFFRREKDV